MGLFLSPVPHIVSTGVVIAYAVFLFALVAVLLSPFRKKWGLVNILVIALLASIFSFFGFSVEATAENKATVAQCSEVVRLSSADYGYYHDDDGYHVEVGKNHRAFDVDNLNKGTSSHKQKNHMVVKYYKPKKSTPASVRKYIANHRVISVVIYTHPDNDPLNFK